MSLWAAVDRVVDRTTDLDGLRAHGLDLWAARRWYETGRVVPSDFLEHELAAAMAVLSVQSQLAWVRGIVDGPILLLKGPEVAARYPDPALRPFGDLDLLVPCPDEAQRMLIAAGCQEVSIRWPYHCPTLHCPESLLLLEIHERPRWPDWTTARTDELFASAIPSVLNVPGVLTVPPAQHAVLLAAHSWRHAPLRRLIDLVDIAAMADGLDAELLQDLADQWGLGRVWRTTIQAIEAFCMGRRPAPGLNRLLGRHLWEVRDHTPKEFQLARAAAYLWAPTPLLAGQLMTRKAVQRLRTHPVFHRAGPDDLNSI